MAQINLNEPEVRSLLQSIRSNAKALLSPRLTPFLFFLDFFVYPPIIVASVVWGLYLNQNYHAWFAVSMIPFGLLTWTFAEYVIHRFVFHRVPIIQQMHQAHHNETLALIGTPTLLSCVALLFFVLLPLSYLLGTSLALLVFSGFMFGFLSYNFVHYAVHHLSSGGYHFMKKLKWQHNVHHHGSSDFNFGVTTALWDHVFRTYSSKMHEDDGS